MTSPFTYDFGYDALLCWGHAIPLVGGVTVAALGFWLGWGRVAVAIATLIAVWGIAGLLIMHIVMESTPPSVAIH